METRVLRVTDAGTDECICRLEGDELVMDLRLVGQKPRTTRKKFGSNDPQRYSPPADWHYPQLVGRKMGEGFVLFRDGRNGARYETLFRSAGGSSTFDLHPDSQHIVYATLRSEAYGADLHVLDLRTGRSRTIHGEEYDHANPNQTWIRDVRYHPSGTAIYYTLNRATLKLDLKPAKRRVVERSEGKLVARKQAKFLFGTERGDARLEMDAARSRLLAYLEHGSKVRVLATEDDRVLFEQGEWGPDYADHATATISPSGKLVAIADDKHTIAIFDVAKRKEIAKMTLEKRVFRLGFSPDEKRIFVSHGLNKEGPFVHELGNKNPLFHFTDANEYAYEVRAWAFAPDGKTIVLASRDLRVADPGTGHDIEKLDGGAARAVFSSDGRLLVSGGFEFRVRKATADPVPWHVPEVTPVAADAVEARGFDAQALLREWDGMHESGEFPCGEGYFGNKFDHWDARLEVYANWAGDEPRYVVVFQVIGQDYGADDFGNSLYSIGDRVDWPSREMAGNASITCPQQTRITDDYSLSDEEAREEDVDYAPEPQDPDGDWARLQSFKVCLGETEYTLTPTLEDYARTDITLTERQYKENLTIARGSIAKMANLLLQDKMWVQDPVTHPDLAVHFADGPFTRIYFEEGVDVVNHVTNGGAPSTFPRWQKIARLLADGVTEEVRADMDRVEAAVRGEYFPRKPADEPLTDDECGVVVGVKLNDDRRATDLSFLARVPNVRLLWLFRTQVSDLSVLARLPHLEELNLAGCPVADLSPLAHCKKLRRLTLSGTRVKDLSPLAELRALQSLDIQSTGVSDLAPLRGHAELRELFLDSTDVTHLAPLRGLQLVRLFMQRTEIADVSPLAKMTSLRVLTLPPTAKKLETLSDLAIYDQLVKDHRSGSGAMASKYVR